MALPASRVVTFMLAPAKFNVEFAFCVHVPAPVNVLAAVDVMLTVELLRMVPDPTKRVPGIVVIPPIVSGMLMIPVVVPSTELASVRLPRIENEPDPLKV